MTRYRSSYDYPSGNWWTSYPPSVRNPQNGSQPGNWLPRPFRDAEDRRRFHIRVSDGTIVGGVTCGCIEESVSVVAMRRRQFLQANWRSTVIERTLSIIKPDATRRNLTGKINSRLEEAGLRIVAQKRLQLTAVQAEMFYDVHRERPFFSELCEFMTSGPVVVQVLEGQDAISRNREVMGATNPAEADEGTIRRDLALSLTENSVHGSDGPDTAAVEIGFFFAAIDITD